MSISPDQGSDGICAYNFLVRELGYNADLTPDPSHSINNDMWLAFQEAGIKPQMLLWMIAFNIPQGPWHSDARWHEVRSALQELFSESDARSSPLFMAMAPSILQDPAYADIVEESGDPYDLLWQRLGAEHPFLTKGVKQVKSRFMSFLRKAKSELQVIHSRAFGYLYVCLEQGYLNDKNIEAINLPKVSPPEPATATTHPGKETMEERALRSSCANNMVVGCMQHNDQEAITYLKIAVEVVAPLEPWHSEQNVRLRSVSQAGPWMIEQLVGGFMQSVCSTVKVVSQEKSFLAIPLVLPSSPVPESERDEVIGASFQQDRYAQVLADGALALAGLRIQRNLWMLRGWPSRLVIALRAEFRPLVATALRRDYENFKAFSANVSGADGIDTICARSIFHLRAVMQDVLVLEQASWTVTDEFVGHIERCNSRIISSQICEDCFNRQKNGRKAPNRRGIVEKSWAIVSEKQVMDVVHKFDTPSVSAAPAVVEPLPPSVFRPHLPDTPKDFHQLVGFKSSPSWYSPGAASFGQAYSDLSLIEFAHHKNLHRFVRNRWLGEFCQAKHHILLRHVYDAAPSQWYFALRFVPDSCMIL